MGGQTATGLVGQPGRLGLWLVAVCSAAIIVGVWALVPSREWTACYLVAVAGLIAAIGLRVMPGSASTGARRLLFPLVVLAELLGLGWVDPSASQPYLPMITLAFIYVGLTCPPHRSWWLLIPAATAWLVAYDVPTTGLSAALFIRLPIGMAVWALVAELLARHVGRLRRHTDQLADEAHTDALTGLANRRLLPQLLGNARAGDALVMLDVDHFRHINERYGHAGGDEVLRVLGSVVRSTLRRPDHAVRYGGEEILLLLPGVPDVERVDAALERLTRDWAAASSREAHESRVTFSAGAVILRELESPGEAVRAADTMLYEAKQAGRNCWRVRAAAPISTR